MVTPEVDGMTRSLLVGELFIISLCWFGLLAWSLSTDRAQRLLLRVQRRARVPLWPLELPRQVQPQGRRSVRRQAGWPAPWHQRMRRSVPTISPSCKWPRR